jgi:hypothetical protein
VFSVSCVPERIGHSISLSSSHATRVALLGMKLNSNELTLLGYGRSKIKHIDASMQLVCLCD